MPAISTADLAIAYTDSGSGDAGVALLIHGWPDDPSTWDAILPRLHAAGWRTIVPTLRGFGETRFISDAPRTGNSAIHALDMIALMDGLGIESVCVIGHDWGANIAEALAVGWPSRVQKIAMLSTPPRLGGMATPPFWHAQRQWYHWFMATKRGAEAVRADPKGFAHIHWQNWSPPGWFDEATFARVSQAWENPDWVDVTLHSYRSRWDEAEPDPQSTWLEDKVKSTHTLSLPVLYLHGECDGVNPPATAENVPEKFTGWFEKVELVGVGHFPQREDPEPVATAILRLLQAKGADHV